MKDLLDQIDASMRIGLYAPALMTAMMLPDAGGAVDYPTVESGAKRKNGDRYALWIEKWVEPLGLGSPMITGKVLWVLRNAMLHETTLNLSGFGIGKFTFTLPTVSNIVVTGSQTDSGGISGTIVSMHMPDFVSKMTSGARNWIEDVKADPVRSDLLGRLFQYRPFGLQGHIVGLPLFG